MNTMHGAVGRISGLKQDLSYFWLWQTVLINIVNLCVLFLVLSNLRYFLHCMLNCHYVIQKGKVLPY